MFSATDQTLTKRFKITVWRAFRSTSGTNQSCLKAPSQCSILSIATCLVLSRGLSIGTKSTPNRTQTHPKLHTSASLQFDISICQDFLCHQRAKIDRRREIERKTTKYARTAEIALYGLVVFDKSDITVLV